MTGPTLGEAFTKLQVALDPLAIEVGLEVLDVWRDRARAGREPIPASALKNLAAVVDQLLLARCSPGFGVVSCGTSVAPVPLPIVRGGGSRG